MANDSQPLSQDGACDRQAHLKATKSMTQIALLSHRFGNIGHNFMALGAEEAAREAFGSDVTITHFEQHTPFCIYPHGHWLRWIDKIPHGRAGWLRKYLTGERACARLWKQAQPLPYHLAVACGGPTMVAGAGNTPEMRVMSHHFYGAFAYQGVPVIDAAVGSCFPLERVPAGLNALDQEYYRRLIRQTRLITVRDPVARDMYATVGCTTPLLPCIALGSGRIFEAAQRRQAGEPQYVVINFQAKGSNEDWGQGVDATAWARLVSSVISDLRHDGHKVMMLCHSPYEARLARNLAPDTPTAVPKSESEYAEAIARAKVGFVSRIHAGVALAGIGVPSVVVGNDTRLGTTTEMGLPSYSTKKLTREFVVAELRRLLQLKDEEKHRLIRLREDTLSRYSQLFAQQARNQL
jgi:hypothetical protein